MKVLKKIRKRIIASRSSGEVIGTNNLPPITFHSNHGEYIQLSRNGAVAKRAESFCKGITFSNRPVQINEKIFLKFAETSTNWSGVIRFGFTSVDPSSVRTLPKYACPDFTNRMGYWAKALAERYAQQDAVLFYYVTANGDVHFGINGEEKGVFFGGVDTSGPLWAMLDIYGNTIAMELLDSRHQLNNMRNAAVSNNADQDLSQAANRISLHDHGRQLFGRISPTIQSLAFHNIHGKNIQFLNNSSVAVRSDSEYAGGYVFTERPLRPEEQLVIQILQTDSSYAGALTFGLTACDPATLLGRALPDDSDLLLDRPEYWVVVKDVASMPQNGDILRFTLTKDATVLFGKNDQIPAVILHVDNTQQLWAFFDLYGQTVKINLIGISNTSATSDARTQRNNELRVILPPSNNTNTCLSLGSKSPHGDKEPDFVQPFTAMTANLSRDDGSQDNANNECSICYERPVNCVLYSCGHMCMCYNCAVELWHKHSGGQCPICRADIKDVIKTYRS